MKRYVRYLLSENVRISDENEYEFGKFLLAYYVHSMENKIIMKLVVHYYYRYEAL